MNFYKTYIWTELIIDNNVFEKNNDLKFTLGNIDNINSKNKVKNVNVKKQSNSQKIDKNNPIVDTSISTEIKDKDSVQKENNNIKYKNNNLFQEKIMKKIHIYHILKSYLFCFND